MTKSTEKQRQPENSWYEIKAAGKRHADVYVYGEIGYWGITAKEFARDLKALGKLNTIDLHVNSIGGSVGDGVAIYNLLKNHAATVTSYIDGYALSIGSVIALAGDTVNMADNALYMIHNPWGGAIGDAEEMRKSAEVLDKHKEALLNTYTERTGLDRDTISEMMDAETWMTADEAVDNGFVDATFESMNEAAAALNLPENYEPPKFKRPPADFVRRVTQPAPAPAAVAQPQPKQETAMDENEKNAAEEKRAAEKKAAQAAAEKARAEALENERARRAEIRQVFEPFAAEHRELLDQCLDDPEIGVEAARKALLDAVGKKSPGPTAGDPSIEVGETAQEKFAKGAAAALAIRAGIAKNDERNEFRGYTLLELARASLESSGIRTGRMDKLDVVGQAFTHSTSDFTKILMDTAEKAMLRGYDEAEETFQSWTNRGVLTDFKPTNRVDLNSYPNLPKVPEGGEYKYVTLGDKGEVITLATYGSMFSITRQAIINDDLAAFTRIPLKQGRAAIRTIGNLVYSVLTSNPVMSDGKALFHANHGNLRTGAGISTAAVDAMRVAMATQKEGDALLNIRLANLIVPVALEGIAKTVRDAEFEVDPSAKNSKIPNSVRGTFNVIADARLDADSSTAWYGTAAPGMHDTVEVSYLDGNDRPYLEQRNGWTVDGTDFKVRIDAGVSPLDFRTLAKNPGA